MGSNKEYSTEFFVCAHLFGIDTYIFCQSGDIGYRTEHPYRTGYRSRFGKNLIGTDSNVVAPGSRHVAHGYDHGLLFLWPVRFRAI